MRSNPPTMTQAVEIAIFEQNFKTRFALRTGQAYKYSSTVRPGKEKVGPTFPPVSTREEIPMEIDHSKSKKCYSCGRYGHIARECRSKKVSAITQPNEPPTNQPMKPGQENIQCHYCKQMGHYKSDCEKLKRKLAKTDPISEN